MALFVYVDNSNIWIEGQRLNAVEKGLATDPYDAMRRGIVAQWAYDFGRLYELACPADVQVGRAALFGSRPPRNDSLWTRAGAAGFTPEVFDRSIVHREKQVDVGISTMIVEDSFRYMRPERGDMAVLASGDGDFVPTVKSVQSRGLRFRVVGWKHAISGELRDTADEVVELDGYFDYLTFNSSGWRAA